MMPFVLIYLCQISSATRTDLTIQIPQYQSGYDVKCSGSCFKIPKEYINFRQISNQIFSVIVKFQFVFTKIPQILLTSSQHQEEFGINGYMIEAQNISQTQFTILYKSFSNLYKYFTSQWIALNDQTICVHHACFQPILSNYQFQQRYLKFPSYIRFNNTYFWLENPVGALFITGQYKQDFHSKTTYRIGASLSSITMAGFNYAFIYESTDYSMCVHSIFAPPEFLTIYPYIISSASTYTDLTSFTSFKLDQLQVFKTPTLYLAGFTKYYYNSSINQKVNILDQSYFTMFPFMLHDQISIMRIQYFPFSCSLTAHTQNFTNSTSTFCECQIGYYLVDYTLLCQQCNDTCFGCIYTLNNCNQCGVNQTLIILNSTEPSMCQCKLGYYYYSGTNCQSCNQNCLTCLDSSINCLTCKSNALLNDKSQCACHLGYYMDSADYCQSIQFQILVCEVSCVNCKGASDSECTECSSGKSLINNQCVCPDQSQYIDDQGDCQQCNEECATCSDDSSCLTCKPNLNNYFSEGQCLSCKEEAAMTVDICNYTDCTDQVWTKGEQCDDGNDIDRDGCSNCQIDTNYKCINLILEKSFCYTCSKSCLQCGVNIEKLVTCQQCQDGYYLNNNQCLLCSANCVTCSSFRQCLTCSVMGYQPDISGRCPQCEDNAGFYTIGNQCQTKCGDFIISGIEECDDGNLINGDGCTQECILEQGYILKDGKPYQIPVPNSWAQYVNSTSLTNFTINTDQSDPKICQALKIYIDNYNTSAYNYTVFVIQNILEGQIQCQILFNFTESLNSTSLIHFKIPYAQKSSRRLLDYLYREIIIVPRNVIIYSQSQITQAQGVQGTSSKLTFALYFIGPGTVLLGGFECFFRILDILSWINNLNFINIQYPLNVGMLLQNSGWANIQLIPKFIQLNQPGDPYYTESPQKFMNLGVDPLFINNAYQSLSIIIVIVACHISTYIIHQVIYNSAKKKYRKTLDIIKSLDSKYHSST